MEKKTSNAQRPSQQGPFVLVLMLMLMLIEGVQKDCFGEPPKPTRRGERSPKIRCQQSEDRGQNRTSNLNHQTSVLVSYQRHLICDVVCADLIIMDAHFAVGGQAGGFDWFSVGVRVGDVFG
jgi:hypothetical protein